MAVNMVRAVSLRKVTTPHPMARARAFRRNFKTAFLDSSKNIPARIESQPELRLVALDNYAQGRHAASAPELRCNTHPIPRVFRKSQLAKMVAVKYLLFESAVGFAMFEVVHQADSVGLQLPEVKEAMTTLDKFGKMVKLVSFNPWT